MGIEACGVAVGGEGDGTRGFNRSGDPKKCLCWNLFICKAPNLVLILPIISWRENISKILIPKTE